MAKHKKGDKVRLIENPDSFYAIPKIPYWRVQMRGKMTVSSVEERFGVVWYALKEDEYGFKFREELLEVAD